MLTTLHNWLHHLILIWFGWVQDWGYLGVIILMAMESSIFPVPSEVVIPPAAVLAAQGKLNFWGVVLAGTLGSWVGSAITYAVSRWLGRAFILKYGRWFFISPEKLARAEALMSRYEAGGIFFARLLPVVRHLISIPAGIVRMPFGKFSLMTVIGSFIWCTILAWFGKTIAGSHPELMNDPDALIAACKAQAHWIIIGVAIFAGLYFVMLRMTGKQGTSAQ